MTIVVALKVGDGIVLGADSASTMMAGGTYHNSYFNAEKLIHVTHDLQVGALTYGLGGLNNRSIASLAKDLRAKMTSMEDRDWYVDPRNYSVEQVVEKFEKFYFDELYSAEFGKPGQPMPDMGFTIAGYSTGSDSAEIWRLAMLNGSKVKVQQVSSDDPWECVWEGQPEAIHRILLGYSSELNQRLIDVGMPPDDAAQFLGDMAPLVDGAMPIQDAIDFVHYLIDATCGFVRFSPGHASVAKPIDIAAITKHNGFKWIARKHYYSHALN